MLTVAFRAQRGLSWELSPSSSPVLGKANGYTGNSPWDALGRQLKQVLASSCSGSDLRSSSLSILLCTSLGRVPKQVVGCVGISAERCWLSSLDGDAWDGMKLLSLAVSSHSWNPGNPVALVMPCGKWFDTSPTHCAESAPAWCRAAGLIQCPLAPAPAETMDGASPALQHNSPRS